jgi:hypothetical protein
LVLARAGGKAATVGSAREDSMMLTLLKSAVDDVSATSRTKVAAISVVLLMAIDRPLAERA